MICALIMQYSPQRELYDCRCCNDIDKVARGCNSVPKQCILMDCYCGGNPVCIICKGRGKFNAYKCPKSIANEFIDNCLFKYFYHYRKTNQYPDGGCMLDQPIILIEIFDIMSSIVYNKEMKQLDSRVKK